MPITEEFKRSFLDSSPLVRRSETDASSIVFDCIAVKRTTDDRVEVTFYNGRTPVHRTSRVLEVGDTLFLRGGTGALRGDIPFTIE